MWVGLRYTIWEMIYTRSYKFKIACDDDFWKMRADNMIWIPIERLGE